MFTEQQLVSFGNYLLLTYGVQVHSTDGKNIPIYQREVTDADFCNWKDKEMPDELRLPSQHQIGDKVKVFLMPEGEESFPGFNAEIINVHFYPGKVKYDLEIRFAGDMATRIYNIDSVLISPLAKSNKQQ